MFGVLRTLRWRDRAAVFVPLLIVIGVAADAYAAAFDVKQYRPWTGYAIPNGLWLAADIDGNGRSDIVHVVQGRDYIHTWRSNGNGTFNVGTFRPWAGYAMPNGLWLAADLNGDGREDLVHAVQGRDYVHTWLSNGDGTFRVGTFRPWAGYAIPNGEWRALDIDGDGRDDLVHVVAGRDYVHTWRSRGDGTFNVGTFRPWAGYAMPNGLWLVADLNGDGRQDLVHAVHGRDYVHPWTSNGDGTFRVGTFRPWAGYAIPNGEWRALDIDGDRRDDLVHVVAGRDYVHTWRSRGDGTFNVGTFRPWAGYAMPNGLWLAGDFNGDGRGDLVHAVEGRDYAHTWLSNGDGTFRVGTFSPWRGYAIPNGLWLAADLTGDRKADIFHAVNATDYAHPWLSTLPAPGEFAVDGLEITQAIQNMAHDVPLVAQKATVVRVYPTFNGGAARTVRGRLWVRNTAGAPWQLLTSSNTATVNPAEHGNLRAKREDTNKGLNFVVPGGVLGAGTLVAWMADMQDATTGATVPCSDCAVSNRAAALQASAPLRLRVLGLRYTQGSPPATHQPRAIDYALIGSWLRRAYPIGQLAMGSVTLNATATPAFGCNDANAQATAVRNADIAAGTDRRTHYYALVHDGGFFMRGCAAGIPGSPSPGTVASGPTGAGNWGWDNDGSYGDWYTGHELGHTVGRFHIGSGCGESSDDANYPYPSGQVSGNDGAFVGFDVGDAANGIPMRALPGTQWRDVMSYCANQWLSDYTYTRVRDRLNAENALPAGPEPAIAGAAAPAPVLAAMLEGPPEPVTGGGAAPVEDAGEAAMAVMVTPAGTPPVDVEAAARAPAEPPAPAYDAPPEPTYDAPLPVVDAGPPAPDLPREAGPGAALEPPPGVPTEEPAARRAPPPELAGTVIERREAEGDFLAVVASVNLTARTGDLVDVRRVDKALVPGAVAETATEIRALDAEGEVLETYPAPFLPNSEREPGEDLKGVVDAVIPFPAGARSLELLIEGEVVDRFDAPAPGPAPSAELSVRRVEAPAARDAQMEGDVAVLTWSAAGPTPEGVTYDVQASTDGGQSWHTVAFGVEGNRAEVDMAPFGREGTLDLRVLAKVGFETTVVDTASIDLAEP